VTDEETREPSGATGTAAARADWSHRHRDVSGGWLRPTVFGGVDGLVTNASLIAGVGGGGVPAHALVLTGVAALVGVSVRLLLPGTRDCVVPGQERPLRAG
jgi:VIT1/CCC1 family predicted Fe2+/Mn2+ transporter